MNGHRQGTEERDKAGPGEWECGSVCVCVWVRMCVQGVHVFTYALVCLGKWVSFVCSSLSVCVCVFFLQLRGDDCGD